MKDTQKLRFDVLDGLRGFAMVLVFLNHIDSIPFVQSFPEKIQPYIQFFFSSGKIGISFFFILSGFLMGYLYKNPQPASFIKKRYARIFPPYLTMVVAMTLFRQYPELSLLLRILVIVTIALSVRIVWTHVVEKFKLGPKLITFFLFIQAVTFIWYGFFVMRMPAAWFAGLPFLLREGTITAANATLTLPLGDYLPLIDGVYWSLIPEVLFYLIYPFIFTPLVNKLHNGHRLLKTAFILSLFPFFLSLSIMFKHVRGLGMLFIEYFLYFCAGILISRLVHEKKPTIQLWAKSIFNPYLFFLLLLIAHITQSSYSGIQNTVIKLLWVIPFGVIVYFIIDETTSLHKFISHKFFTFIGTISFSMYIVHTSMVDGMHNVFRPKLPITNILFIVSTLIITIGVSYLLHIIVERLYFKFKEEKSKELKDVVKRPIYVPVIIFLGSIVLIFFTAYSSQFNFFSLQKKYDNVIPSSISILDEPYTFSFTAQDDNMGIILVHLTNAVGDALPKYAKKIDPNKHQRFQIRMKEVGTNEWYASQDTAPGEIGNSSSYPFGFPVIPDSKGKSYLVEMSMKDIDYSSKIIFNKGTYQMTTVHQIPKQTLLKNPVQLLSHLGDKFQTIWTNPEARLVALCVMPFFLLLFVLLYVS